MMTATRYDKKIMVKNCRKENERPFTIAKNSYCKYAALSTNLYISASMKSKGTWTTKEHAQVEHRLQFFARLQKVFST